MRETCPCCGAPCITSTETSASPTAVRRYATPEVATTSYGDALDAALTEATDKILSTYAVGLIRKRALEIAMRSPQPQPREEQP